MSLIIKQVNKAAFGPLFLFVGVLGRATAYCGVLKILKNLWFEKWGMGWGWREVGGGLIYISSVASWAFPVL